MPTTLPAADRLTTADEFVRCVNAGNFERADALLPNMPGMHGDAVWRALVNLHMHFERWADAADCAARVRASDAGVALQRTLCANLASLKIHRPDIYRVVAEADVSHAYSIHALPDGQQTVAKVTPDGSVPLSSDPRRTTTDVVQRLKPHMERGAPMALLSIGDGHVLGALSRNAPELFMGRQQAIYVIEPDPRLILACLLIHDYTGPQGPIEQQRVNWYIGQRWADAFKLDVLTDRYLAVPQLNLKLGANASELENIVQGVIQDLIRVDARCKEQADRYYASMSADDFSQAISGRAARAPRALLITTRYSTVLQYSTTDAADGLRQLGWDVQVIIEPTQRHVITRVALRRALAEFKPDLIFQIDHNRFEHADLFPACVPFVNWIQDLLPHLMSRETGQKLGTRDYVLAPSLQRWVDEYAYPQRQCLEFRKLTRVPARPLSWHARAERVVYVSNWSQRPEQIIDELLHQAQGPTRDVVAAACERMVAHYDQGLSLASAGDVRRLLIDVMHSLELTADESLLRLTATRLFERLNNLLFRHQGLMWAASACDALGLDLEIYGKGWEKQPQFARYAQGSVTYGDDLEALTRSAGVNLVLEPFVCVAHQRLLDSLAAGGCCVVRANPATSLLESIIAMNDAAHPSNTQAEFVARATDRKAAQAVVDACAALDVAPGAFDHVSAVRQLQASGFFPASGTLLPLIDQTCFNDAQQLHGLLQRMTRDDTLRASVARTQRRYVETRYGYAAGMKTMIAFVHRALENESTLRSTKAA